MCSTSGMGLGCCSRLSRAVGRLLFVGFLCLILSGREGPLKINLATGILDKGNGGKR